MITTSAPSTPDRLLQATIHVMLAVGAARATTRAVTEAAGVGRGLLNHYFRWSELRAQAFSAIITGATETWLGGDGAPHVRRERFLGGAFAPEARQSWALWGEALDLARSDPDMRMALARAQAGHHAALSALLAAGVESGAWTCNNPNATAIRLLGLHDGLILLLLSETTSLTPDEAEAHLRTSLSLECPER